MKFLLLKKDDIILRENLRDTYYLANNKYGCDIIMSTYNKIDQPSSDKAGLIFSIYLEETSQKLSELIFKNRDFLIEKLFEYMQNSFTIIKQYVDFETEKSQDPFEYARITHVYDGKNISVMEKRIKMNPFLQDYYELQDMYDYHFQFEFLTRSLYVNDLIDSVDDIEIMEVE